MVAALAAFPTWTVLIGARAFGTLTPGGRRRERGALALSSGARLWLGAMTGDSNDREANLGRLLGLFLVGLLLLGVGVSAAGPDVQVAAHRGGSLLWAENGLTAFRNALALSADYLELDTHLTADGEVVVIHDPTLDRTTTGRGPVASARLADLASTRLRARDGRVTEDGVPTLAQVLDTLKPSPAGLLLEIKVDAG